MCQFSHCLKSKLFVVLRFTLVKRPVSLRNWIVSPMKQEDKNQKEKKRKVKEEEEDTMKDFLDYKDLLSLLQKVCIKSLGQCHSPRGELRGTSQCQEVRNEDEHKHFSKRKQKMSGKNT